MGGGPFYSNTWEILETNYKAVLQFNEQLAEVVQRLQDKVGKLEMRVHILENPKIAEKLQSKPSEQPTHAIGLTTKNSPDGFRYIEYYYTKD